MADEIQDDLMNLEPTPSIEVVFVNDNESMDLNHVDNEAALNHFWNVAKHHDSIVITFRHLSTKQCIRHLQELIKIADELGGSGPNPEFDRQYSLYMDSCSLDSICFHRLARLDLTGLCSDVNIGFTCKFVSFGPNPEESLVACLSRNQLKSLATSLMTDPLEAAQDNWDNAKPYFRMMFGIGNKLDDCSIMELEAADVPVVATPVLRHAEAIAHDTRVMCTECLLATAAMQVPTLTQLDTGIFHPDAPFLSDGYFTALMKRPANSEPLDLISTPEKSQFTTRILPILNEKNLAALPIVLDPAIHATAPQMLEQALTVIGGSLHIRELRYHAMYSQAMDHTLVFMRGLRKIAPRLRAPLELTMEVTRLIRMEDPECVRKLTEFNRLVHEMRKVEMLFGHKDLRNLVLLLHTKLPNVGYHSTLRMLSNDIFRHLREYIMPKFR